MSISLFGLTDEMRPPTSSPLPFKEMLTLQADAESCRPHQNNEIDLVQGTKLSWCTLNTEI